MEKGPEFRIVGGASPEKKQELKEELQGSLFSHFESLPDKEIKELKKYEYAKSEKENSLIDFANQETNKLMQEAGVKPYDIPYENYHIISPKLYHRMAGKGDAFVSYRHQGMFFNAEGLDLNPLSMAESLLHETLHMKSHLAAEVTKSGDTTKKRIYRAGVSAMSAIHAEPHEHFRGLNEAIVATESKKLFPKMLNLPAFQKEKEWLISDEAREARKDLGLKHGIPEDDFLWVGKKGQFERFPTPAPREVLNYICAEIQKDRAQEYQKPDDVFKEFLKSHLNGQLLPIARLVERTFGQGSFRLLGNMTEGNESAVLHTESLRKARIRQLKSETK